MRFPWHIYKITGHSMEPALPAGSYVLAKSKPAYRPGEIVVFAGPDGSTLLIKRIAATTAGGYIMLGDNGGDSWDSRDFGPVSQQAVRGVVIWY
jgi:nickel-type superoxide dismutase maturation protease